jgi:hypothetical protein
MLDMMAEAVITATWEAEISRSLKTTRKTVHKTPSQPMLNTVACVCHPSYMGRQK